MDPQQGAAPPDLIIGQTIGNYRVTTKIGEGGMGSVYLAEHPEIGKKVALKVLHSEFTLNEDVTKRFFHEAKAVNDIGHPNIVDIVDYGVIQTGANERLVYFIMEYLSGISLSSLMRNEGPMAPERAFGIVLQVADALAASHKCGIVHRDLKPDNIMLQQRGREREFVKLLDFGIAKLTTQGGSKGRTQTGMVLGTPAYMSPEQCEGRGNVDHRTDIYALGILLYEMLTGQVPFTGEGYGEILIQHLTRIPDPPSKYRMLNLHVEATVMKALQKNPDLRYPTMDEMMRAMTDPIGYVEAHGGLQGFMQAQLMPSSAPLPSMRFTPAPYTTSQPAMMQPTPAPGYMTTPHGIVTPKPTTLGAATGEATEQPKRSKAGFVIAGTLVVAAAAAGVAIVAGGGSSDTKAAKPIAGTNDSIDPGSGSAAIAKVDPGSADPGSAGPIVNGSAGSASLGSAGSAGSASAGSGGAGSAELVPPPQADVARITLRTKPEGAKIYVNGTEISQRTPQPFLLPYSKEPVKIVLKLDKHEEIAIPLKVTGDFDHEYTLKKKRSVVGGGKGSGSGKGSGKGNDTGLMNPDDI